MARFEILVIKASLNGICPDCEEPACGEMDLDEETFQMDCVNCAYKETFKTADFNWNVRRNVQRKVS